MRTLAVVSLLIGICAITTAAQEKSVFPLPDVTIAPRSSPRVAAEVIDPASEPALSPEEKLRLIRRHIKYVFVLFQENRSFDFYFAAYPGADGLYAGPDGPRTPAEVAGFTQTIVNTDGSLATITPFRIPATVVDAKGKTVPI
jgi:phospholipase C